MRRRRPVVWMVVVGLLCAAALVVAGAVWRLRMPVGSGPRQVVRVRAGESAAAVAARLAEKGLIRDPTALAAAAYVTGKWRRIQAGRHELDPGMSALEILESLCRGTNRHERWITIPEGYTVWQIARTLENEGICSAEAFRHAAARPRSFAVDFPVPEDSLEGYLFPDTYCIGAGETVEEIMAQMLERFEEVVWAGIFDRMPERNGRSLRDILILASLVEWEAQQDEERPIIAGVLMNRLERGQRLECDATVQYALGEARKARLTYDDLQIESEYNTYLHEGLPPGPICNPGEASIRAAAQPAAVRYLYYVARPDGSHIFSRTYAEHQAAVASARRER